MTRQFVSLYRIFRLSPATFGQGCLDHRIARIFCSGLLGLAVMGGHASAATSAVLVVNSLGDLPDHRPGVEGCDTNQVVVVSTVPLISEPECTLRAAIQEANAASGPDVIFFSTSLPTSAGYATIRPNSVLPVVTDSTMIDGYTAPGYLVSSPGADPVINLDGGRLSGFAMDGLAFTPAAENSTVRGLAIHSFPDDGIDIDTGSSNGLFRVEGCHLGVEEGVVQVGNGGNGIVVTGNAEVVIGRDCSQPGCPGKRNLISANQGNGVRASGSGTRIAGNLIGTDRTGSQIAGLPGGDSGNHAHGIALALFFVTVGSMDPLGGNVISGNHSGGIRIDGSRHTIQSNLIGTNLAGTAALPNDGPGIVMSEEDNLIGGDLTAGGNVISGNAGIGIDSLEFDSVFGNTIGLTKDRLNPLGNGGAGIRIRSQAGYLDGNVIAANGGPGIEVYGDDTRIDRNWVGTNGLGDGFPSDFPGIQVDGENIEIGQAGAGNVVGSHATGIVIDDDAEQTRILSNYIGTDAAGTDLGNSGAGILVVGPNARIGSSLGFFNLEANVIGFNQVGIDLQSDGSLVRGNHIGTNATGADLGNLDHGVRIQGAANLIGAPNACCVGTDTMNVIAHNGGSAVVVVPGPFYGNVIRTNEMFGNGGLAAIDLSSDGRTPNDFGDSDVGSNRLQNFPEFNSAATQWNESTGELEIRYRINSNATDAAYPIDVDFYLRETLDDQSGFLLGTDIYPVGSATSFRNFGITSIDLDEMGGLLVAIATDAEGNSSEISTQLIAVPEAGRVSLLLAGILWMIVVSYGPMGKARRLPLNDPQRWAAHLV